MTCLYRVNNLISRGQFIYLSCSFLQHPCNGSRWVTKCIQVCHTSLHCAWKWLYIAVFHTQLGPFSSVAYVTTITVGDSINGSRLTHNQAETIGKTMCQAWSTDLVSQMNHFYVWHINGLTLMLLWDFGHQTACSQKDFGGEGVSLSVKLWWPFILG